MAMSQMPPDWWESTGRQFHYPQDEWYSGFVIGEQQPGETLEDVYARLKDEARVEAESSIRMYIEKKMLNSNRSELLQTTTQFEESITEVFESKTVMSVEMEIPGLRVEAWQNPKTNDIGAFAYVSRKELIRKTEKQITIILTKIELALDNVNQLIEAGQKVKARESAKNTLPMFTEIEQTQKLLLAISDDTETLELEETHSLQQRLIKICSSLQHGLKLYIKCSALLGNKTYPTLQKELQAKVSEIGCEYVDSAKKADWSIYINSKTREFNKVDYGGITMFVMYVDADISIDKQSTEQRVYANEIHKKGTHTIGNEEAAMSAYSSLVDDLAKTIKDVIKE